MEKKDWMSHMRLGGEETAIFNVRTLEEKGVAGVDRLPFCMKILAENLMRKLDGRVVTQADIEGVASWGDFAENAPEIPFYPARVLMQDFTGVPAVVDMAAMRSAFGRIGKDPALINPAVPVDLVIDHSVAVDYHGSGDAMEKNMACERERNAERYQLLKWAGERFENFRIVPTGTGICHQVNLEYLSSGVTKAFDKKENRFFACPDTLVGTDSHTTMINGIGVMAWGVGGIEAEAVMLGEPCYMALPEVAGVRLTGEMGPRTNATDAVLHITHILRQEGVVGKFVEFFGPGARRLTAFDRATIANMAPEYGATMGFFPTDEKTVDYFKMTGRKEAADILERYAKETGLFMTGGHKTRYARVIDIALDEVSSLVSGPSQPSQKIRLKDLKPAVSEILAAHAEKRGKKAPADPAGGAETITDGSVLIAAITSCTNTSNPFALISAGLMAKNCVEKGLRVSPDVKTSFAPGSKVPVRYLREMGLLEPLEALGFHVAAFGCTTCIGNSGPLRDDIQKAVLENDLFAASALSGNRNFEARIHPDIKGNFLASPTLVTAFAVAGRIGIDFETEPLGTGKSGEPVFLKDVFPDMDEVRALFEAHQKTEHYESVYAEVFEGDESWRALSTSDGDIFSWDPDSTYIKEPSFFENFMSGEKDLEDIEGARALLLLGDRVTTDHISPAGAIPEDYPAGRYLKEKGAAPADFNSYGSRRGNHEVMARGTFANIRIKNALSHPKEGGHTRILPDEKDMFVFDAASRYRESQTPLVVLAGKEYGTGSSRDWAAKGSAILGIKAVIARSFERIHRSNLVCMGVLPLVFDEGESWESLGIDGSETFSIHGLGALKPGAALSAEAVKPDGKKTTFKVAARVESRVELSYLKQGGIIPYVLKKSVG
ncbi:aconitate hydratase 1 [Candidatus Desulfarcum epimagneticum]|uniref:Aconitate hydratase n=1 Tax=uncultured Desulfobacteraceae bacterium TaxID=218296 RepID=A0A484HIX7_9BACT|nr:aconitate hydratase 1 [uncultured Desulfobacteraceae bacterium]